MFTGTASIGYRRAMSREQLYPPIEPYQTGRLRLDDIHTMYWEQSGNPRGVPVVFLHGGPGAGATPVHRRFFDPRRYRIVVFDQRGAGRSSPVGELRDNTTRHLIADMEQLREDARHRALAGVRRLVGLDARARLRRGASGALPGLRAARHLPRPRPQEIDWFLYGLRNVFPEAWRKFVAPDPGGRARRPAARLPPPPHRSRSRGASRRRARLVDLRRARARPWCPSPETVAAFGEANMAFGLARIETHYFIEDDFLQRGPAAARPRAHPPPAGDHRAGPLRHDLPDRHRGRAGARLARGGIRHRARRGPFGARSRASARRWCGRPNRSSIGSGRRPRARRRSSGGE